MVLAAATVERSDAGLPVENEGDEGMVAPGSEGPKPKKGGCPCLVM